MARLVPAALLSTLVLAVAAAGPSPAADEVRLRLDPLPNVKAGRVADSRAFIALSLDGTRLRVYICDGTLKRKPTVAKWFRGRWDGHSPLTMKAGDLELHVDTVAPDGSVTGRVILEDGEHAFSARPRTHPAGLHHGARKGLSATWIVLSERSMRGNFVPARPPRCRLVAVTSSSGGTQWVTVC
jgi:hypothetical protein